MNQTQVQVFRLILRNLQTSLVDLSYGFSLKCPPNAKETIVTPHVLSIDQSIRSIVSTFDEKIKSEVVRNYLSLSYWKIIEFKEKYEPLITNDIKNLKTDFILFLKQESTKNVEGVPSDHGNFEILKDQILSKLKTLDEPFSDISSPPFDIVEYFLSFKEIIPFQEESLKPIINLGNLYIYFFKFLRQLHLLENYKNRFEDGDIPSDCSQHLVEANYVPDQAQSTKVIMPLVKTPKIDPSVPSWSILPIDSNPTTFNRPENYSVSLKNKFSGLKLNGLVESPDPIYVQPGIICDTKVFDPNDKSFKPDDIYKINSKVNSKPGQQSSKENNSNISNENTNPQTPQNNVSNTNNNTNSDSNKNNITNKTNITNDNNNNPENDNTHQRNRVKGSKIGTSNSKSLSSLKLGSKSSLAMLQKRPKATSKKTENADDINLNGKKPDESSINNNRINNNIAHIINSNNSNNNNTISADTKDNPKNSVGNADTKTFNNNSTASVDSNNSIFNAIKGISSLDDNNDSMNTNNFLEDYRKGVIAINNSIYNDNKSDSMNNPSQDDLKNINIDDDSTLSRYAQMVQKLETSKQQLQEWSQIIIARLQQKALLLQKENQLLRENLDIVSKQKSEIVEMYETQIHELSEQSVFLRNENIKLKKQVSTVKSDYEPE